MTQVPPGVDANTPAPSRLCDGCLGAAANDPVGHAAGATARRLVPELADATWANRDFHQRAARWLAAERGVPRRLGTGAGPGAREDR